MLTSFYDSKELESIRTVTLGQKNGTDSIGKGCQSFSFFPGGIWPHFNLKQPILQEESKVPGLPKSGKHWKNEKHQGTSPWTRPEALWRLFRRRERQAPFDAAESDLYFNGVHKTCWIKVVVEKARAESKECQSRLEAAKQAAMVVNDITKYIKKRNVMNNVTTSSGSRSPHDISK